MSAERGQADPWESQLARQLDLAELPDDGFATAVGRAVRLHAARRRRLRRMVVAIVAVLLAAVGMAWMDVAWIAAVAAQLPAMLVLVALCGLAWIRCEVA